MQNLLLNKKDINKEKSKSDDLEKIKKDIPLLSDTESISNYQPKELNFSLLI